MLLKLFKASNCNLDASSTENVHSSDNWALSTVMYFTSKQYLLLFYMEVNLKLSIKNPYFTFKLPGILTFSKLNPN
jgi:hypothetical protein